MSLVLGRCARLPRLTTKSFYLPIAAHLQYLQVMLRVALMWPPFPLTDVDQQRNWVVEMHQLLK